MDGQAVTVGEGAGLAAGEECGEVFSGEDEKVSDELWVLSTERERKGEYEKEGNAMMRYSDMAMGFARVNKVHAKHAKI